MKTQVTFSQEEIDAVFKRRYDCLDYNLRKNAAEYQEKINKISEREKQRLESKEKWTDAAGKD